MSEFWVAVLRVQSMLWLILQYILVFVVVSCAIAIPLGVAVGKYFNAKEKRMTKGR